MSAALIGVCVFLAATSLVVPAFRRLGLSAVMAFLVIGLILGPNGLGRFEDGRPWLAAATLDPEGPAEWLAELGVVFLLFAIGLEISTERLWALRRLVLGLGLAQLGLSAAAIGVIAALFGAGLGAAVVTGLALALSSTALVLQLLAERRQLAGTVGRAGFSVLLMQDLSVIPILFAVAALAGGDGGEGGGLELARALGSAIFTVAAILGLGRYLLRPFFRWAAAIGSREVFVAATLLVVIASAGIAAAAGLSMALGAFLAGLMLAETEFRHEIETDMDPFKGLLLGLFFVTVGMRIQPGLILAEPLGILVGVVGLFVLKAAILVPLARGFGLSWPQSIELGFLLAQAGEFAFVIIAEADAGGLYPRERADYMLLVVALSIFFAPAVASLGARLARGLARRVPQADEPAMAPGTSPVVIAGYGRVGQALGEILQDQDIPHIALDADAEAVTRLRRRGWPVLYGDASRKDVLARFGAENAAAIVVTMDNAVAVERITRIVRRVWPAVPVFARAHDPAHARRLHAAGAIYATPETIEATLQLGEAILIGLGVPDESARRAIDDRRERERAAALHGPPAEPAELS